MWNWVGRGKKSGTFKSQSSLEASTHFTTTHIDLVSLQLVSVLRLAPAAESNGKTIIVLKALELSLWNHSAWISIELC